MMSGLAARRPSPTGLRAELRELNVLIGARSAGHRPSQPTAIFFDEPELGLHPSALALLGSLLDVAPAPSKTPFRAQSRGFAADPVPPSHTCARTLPLLPRLRYAKIMAYRLA